MVDPKQHSAEHILTAVFGVLFGAKIIDGRFKKNKVRCDFEIESELVLEEIIKKAEERANQLIGEGREVTFEEVTLEDARAECSLHRLPDGLDKVRLVRMGDGVVTPCRGEHVENTSEIGTIKIRTYDFVRPGVLRLTFGIE